MTINLSSISGKIAVIVLFFVGGCVTGYRFAYKPPVVAQSPDREEEIAASADTEARQKQKIIYRDVIKYVQNPDRTLCSLDNESVRLRQQAVDSANTISGFDAATVPDKQRWYEQR